MDNKTMPERIRVLQNFSHIQITPLCERVEHDGTYSAVDAQDEQATGIEYVRADLAAGDASEPLEVGQYRWAVKPGIGWFVVVIHKWHGDFFWYPSGNDYTIYAVDELSEIGPVIRPPEDK